MQLLVDDGVSGRGHRTNLFSTDSTVAGNFSGSHSVYNDMTCIAYAGSYDDNPAETIVEIHRETSVDEITLDDGSMLRIEAGRSLEGKFYLANGYSKIFTIVL